MDEAAAAVIKEDGADKRPSDGDASSENVSSAEDTADGVGIFCCQDCGEAFREEDAYLEHRHQHLQENMYLDGQLDGLNDGEKDCEAAHFCTLCSVSFVEASDFHTHMEKNHRQSSQKEPQNRTGKTKQHTYKCPDCGKCYGVIGHFLNHQRSHRQASKSVFHDLEHLKKKSFQCESCGRNYSRASALDAHRRCHEQKLVKSRNRTVGDVCHTEETIVEGKPSEIQTDGHSEKPFTCSCGKAFTALMRLKTHQRFSRNSQCSPEEMKEKSKKVSSTFHCSECKKDFSGHIAIFNHQRWHANRSSNPAKRFPCEECGKVFMTPAFYYRHQRMVHSDETPAKSFDHQVCQLQKKAFECKNCGLKFSRASALHSHELHHTDVFSETEKEAQCKSLPSQSKTVEFETQGTDKNQVECDDLLLVTMAEEDSHVNVTDEDTESYEPGDFNVQVISASESEDEPIQDLNPDLELLCESDYEVREDDDTLVSPSHAVSKPEMDLKIVQIDFELADVQRTPVAREDENKTTEERFDCPECYRWFSSASSLRVHRMWHGIHKRRRQNQAHRSRLACKDCGLKFIDMDVFKTHLHQHALEEDEQVDEDVQRAGNSDVGVELESGRGDKGENGEVDTVGDADGDDTTSSSQTSHSDSLQGRCQEGHACSLCGKVYTYLVSFRKHQQMHENESSKTESQTVENLTRYECPDCGMSFIRRTRLLAHLKDHKANISFKSTTPKCEQCSKDFTSVQSWISHMELHEENPFWCLSCAQGFPDEGALDKHLQTHKRKLHKCNICHKSFFVSAHLMNHYNTHNGIKPYLCTLCKKRFFYPRNLIAHRKNHFHSEFSRRLVFQRRRGFLTIVEEKPEMDANMEKQPGKEEHMEQSEHQKPRENAGFEDELTCGESDCGEPVHLVKKSRHCGLSGSDPLELKSGTVEPHVGQELDESQSQEVYMHKYWEWECWECDMGFDEVEKLHLHYIKHATGELPIPQDVTDS